MLTAGYVSTFRHEMETLNALCRLLHDRHACASASATGRGCHCSSPSCAAASTSAGGPGTSVSGATASTSTWRSAVPGLAWPYGRPLSPTERPSLDSAVERVEQRLQANPYRAGRRLDHDLVVHIVRKEVVDVEPWPFSALVAN